LLFIFCFCFLLVDLPETIPMPSLTLCPATFFERHWNYTLDCALCNGLCRADPLWKEKMLSTPFDSSPQFEETLPVQKVNVTGDTFLQCPEALALGLDDESSRIAFDSFANSKQPDMVACFLRSNASLTQTGMASDAYRLTIMPNIHEPQFGDELSNGWTWITGGNAYLILIEKAATRGIEDLEFHIDWKLTRENIPLVGEEDGRVFSIPQGSVFYVAFKSFHVDIFEEKGRFCVCLSGIAYTHTHTHTHTHTRGTRAYTGTNHAHTHTHTHRTHTRPHARVHTQTQTDAQRHARIHRTQTHTPTHNLTNSACVGCSSELQFL
jgi:hypothetical protein